MPKVSIILPVFNAEKTITRTLESIINSDFKDYEIIICDDNSQDNSLSEINKFLSLHKNIHSKLISNEINSGISVAKNKCISFSSGKYIASLDSDDEIHPKRLSNQVDFLNKNPSITIVGTSQKMIFSNKKWKYNYPPKTDGFIKASLFVRTTMLHPTIMVRAEFLKNHHIKYDTKIRYGQDHIYFLNIYFNGGKFANIHNVYDTYNFRNKKKWEIKNNENFKNKSLTRGKILERINLQPNKRNYYYFNLLNFIEKPKSFKEFLKLLFFVIVCIFKVKTNYGGIFCFTLSRIKDIGIIVKNYFSNNINSK